MTADTRSLLWFAVPSLALLAAVLLYPLGYSVYLSLHEVHLASAAQPFAGWDNYAALLTQERFWSSLATTLKITAAAVTLEFMLGFALALALYRLTAGARVFNVLLFLPHIITPVVAALFLRWMFVSQWGLIDATLAAAGVVPPDWLGHPLWAKVTVVLADAWKFTPFVMLVLYAGLQGIDQSILEAAAIDGAGGFRLVWSILLPSLKPLVLFVLAIRTMDCFRAFDAIYVLTGGGPGTATETITLYTYVLGFRQLEIGKAAALGVLTLIILSSIVGTMIFMLYRRERQAF
jgi:multiple sugar transport system permease protein